MNMKTHLLTSLILAVVTQTLSAQQFTPPALPPGVKSSGESFDADIVKIYSMEDQGAKFRAYVVNYKGTEVIVGDLLAQTSRKVGDKIKVNVVRVEQPFGTSKIHTMTFQISPTSGSPKK
jgi:hypothetical protein